jgi:hypothetical protein
MGEKTVQEIYPQKVVVIVIVLKLHRSKRHLS